jgi:5-methylcytosine-specific restriction enzyme A
MFEPNLKPGEILTNKDICRIFQCSPQGGMRRSKRTNSLVIVSDHLKGIYEDRWVNDILHYTGMGLTGNQSLFHAQNKTLQESLKSGIGVFLFEVFDTGKYIFQGRVILSGQPYKETQPDIKENKRDVWVFPLKLEGQATPGAIPEEIFQKKVKLREKQVRKLSDEELHNKIVSASRKSGMRQTISTQYERSQYVVEYAKRRANGKCQLCENPAPFFYENGEPFLEIHHIEWFAKGGEDTLDNTVALCPNCHRKLHILDLETDKKSLKEKVKNHHL